MAKKQPFSLVFSPRVKAHLADIDSKWDSLIRSKIEEQLLHEPDVETRNRKRFKRRPSPYDADWELRFGPDNRFRVLYTIEPEAREVLVLGIGVKEGNRLLFGGEEMEL